MLVCDVSVGCTCTVLLHILSGSVWVCNLWSARLWECNAHDWLKGCVVGQNRFHLHVSPIMSHAHSSSSSFLHVSVLSSSSSSLSLFLIFDIYTSQYMLPISWTLRRSTKWRVWPCGWYNVFHWCWLHHCEHRNERKMKDKHELITLKGNLMRSVCRSEKQMHNEHELITLNVKAWWQVLLEIS